MRAGTADPTEAHEAWPVFSRVRVARSLVFCVVYYGLLFALRIIVCIKDHCLYCGSLFVQWTKEIVQTSKQWSVIQTMIRNTNNDP
jgi:hypothetical protein